jgi:hypothetical protein
MKFGTTEQSREQTLKCLSRAKSWKPYWCSQVLKAKTLHSLPKCWQLLANDKTLTRTGRNAAMDGRYALAEKKA